MYLNFYIKNPHKTFTNIKYFNLRLFVIFIFHVFLQDFRQVVPKSVPAGLENKRTFFADSDRLWLRGMYAMLAIISCNAQLLSVHSFIFIVIVSRLFPFVTTYFVFSPFFVGFYVLSFDNDSCSSFSLNFVSGSLTPPSSKNLSKRCKRLIFLSIS